MNITVIIPAYKNAVQLARCLAALEVQTCEVDPYVIDNNVDNIGFTRAINKGLRAAINAGHEFAILLNQDCYLNDDAAERAIAFMKAHPRCAIGGFKQLSTVDPNLIIHGGCIAAYPAGRHITGRVDAGDCSVSLPMPWVNGAAMIVRLNAILDFGLMDERMFLIGSESDWCYRARWTGWEVWYIADAVCQHECGVSFKTPSADMLAIMQRDMAVWRDKWVGSRAYASLRL